MGTRSRFEPILTRPTPLHSITSKSCRSNNRYSEGQSFKFEEADLSTSLSRRGFVSGSIAAAGASLSFAQSDAMQARLMPQAISALPNLSGQARPFTNAERQARIERARALMAENKIDAVVLANSSMSSVYFANMRLGGGERLWALVIPAKSDAFVVCPAFEEGRAREMMAGGPLMPNADVLTWQEDQSPYEGIA